MKKLLTIALLAGSIGVACAADVTLSKCVIQASTPGTKMTGAFLDIKSTKSDALVSATSSAAGRVEIHGMKMSEGVMEMYKIDSLPINVGDTRLAKGGYHVMLFDLKNPIVSGKSYPLTLKFKNAGEVSCQAVAKKAEEILKLQSGKTE